MARVLLIEDDPEQREIYRLLLYYNGFEVLTAEDGVIGVSMAQEVKPDVILADVMLPRLNGLIAARVIKSNPATAQIPIVCMSAYDVDANQVVNSGAQELLVKPVSGDKLVRVLRKYVGWDPIQSVEKPQ